jgi:hypothetical protein
MGEVWTWRDTKRYLIVSSLICMVILHPTLTRCVCCRRLAVLPSCRLAVSPSYRLAVLPSRAIALTRFFLSSFLSPFSANHFFCSCVFQYTTNKLFQEIKPHQSLICLCIFERTCNWNVIHLSIGHLRCWLGYPA